MKHKALFKDFYERLVAVNILPIYSESTVTKPTANHFRVLFRPAGNALLNACSGKSENQWIIKVNIHVRESGEILEALDYGDALVAAFPAGTIYTAAGEEYHVAKAPTVYTPIPKPGWLVVPVDIRLVNYG